MWTYYVCILYLALYIYWFILQIIYDGVVFFYFYLMETWGQKDWITQSYVASTGRAMIWI